MRKIILILVLVFSLFTGNVFWYDVSIQDQRTIDLNRVHDAFVNDNPNWLDRNSQEYQNYQDKLQAVKEKYDAMQKEADSASSTNNWNWEWVWENTNLVWSDTSWISDKTEREKNQKKLEDWYTSKDTSSDTNNTTTSSNSNWIEVKVTEKIPGADCSGTSPNITCTVKPGFWSVMMMMWGIIKYFTFLSALGWVLFIVVNWILLSMSWMWWDDKGAIKKRITMTIGWLILLLLSGLILHSIAPWIYN